MSKSCPLKTEESRGQNGGNKGIFCGRGKFYMGKFEFESSRKSKRSTADRD